MAVLVNPASYHAETTVRDVETAAPAMGLQIQILNASTSREIDAAFATLVRERPDALFVGADLLSTPGVFTCPPAQRAMGSLRFIRSVIMPKPAG